MYAKAWSNRYVGTRPVKSAIAAIISGNSANAGAIPDPSDR